MTIIYVITAKCVLGIPATDGIDPNLAENPSKSRLAARIPEWYLWRSISFRFTRRSV